MSEPFLGEIKVISWNFPPKGWAFCNGQLLPINQNTALFSILGTTYGGDGRTTFALPDLRGRTLVGTGTNAATIFKTGDRLRTAQGTLRPVIWIGWRRTDIARHPDPASVRPVRVAAHALGPNMPHRDLWLSPDHALFIDGVLIPVRYLINDATIVQEHRDEVTYWHVELDQHEVILAEG